MDEKRVDEIFMNIFESMTDEQKEAVKKCKTEDEFAKFMDENIELPEELLEEVAGGGFGSGSASDDPKVTWEKAVEMIGYAAVNGYRISDAWRRLYS